MLTAISQMPQNVQISTLRESKRNASEEKVNEVALNGLQDTVITIYNNTSQLSDFFSVLVENPESLLVYKPLLSQMDQSTAYIHVDKGEGFIQSTKIDPETFSMNQFYQSLVGQVVRMYHKEGALIEGKVLDWNQDALTIYDTHYEIPRIIFFKREEITGIACDDLNTKMSIEPSLKAKYITENPEEIEGQVISLNNGLTWKAYYRLIIEETKKGLQGRLEADAQISNKCGKDLKNMVVKVVSGNLNMEMPKPLPRSNFCELKALPSVGASQMQAVAIDQKWEDLKAYLIPYKMNLLNNETISTRLFDSKEVKLQKSHLLHSYEYQNGERHLSVCYRIENTLENHLNQAFPNGKITVYRKEGKSLNLIGQHSLEQTPKGKDLKIITSESFDLIAKRSVQTQNVKDLLQNVIGQDFFVKIELTNGSDQDQTVFLHEHLSKGYSIVKADNSLTEKDGEELVFEVKVPKNTTSKNPLVFCYQYRRDFI